MYAPGSSPLQRQQHIQSLQQFVLNPENQRTDPVRSSLNCFTLASYYADPQAKVEWWRLATYCASLGTNRGSLTDSARWFVSKGPQLAERDANNQDLQRTAPLYCAVLSSFLAENKSGEEFLHWKSTEAYCFAFHKDNISTQFAVEALIHASRERAKAHALDETKQQANPLYVAQLCKSLAPGEEIDTEKAIWFQRAAYFFLLAGNFPEFRLCFGQYEKYCVSKPLNMLHILISFFSNNYCHVINVSILEALIREAKTYPDKRASWAEQFNSADNKSCWTAFSLLIDTIYYHWEEISEEARNTMLNHMLSLIPICPPAVWTLGLRNADGKLLETPLRLIRLLLNKAPADEGVSGLVNMAILHASDEAWQQEVDPTEGSMYQLYQHSLEGSLQETFNRRFSLAVPEGALAAHSLLKHSSPCPAELVELEEWGCTSEFS